MTNKIAMNLNNTNNGSFVSSNINIYLKGSVFVGMSNDLQSVIKPVDKKTSKGGRNGATQIDSFKLWLPSFNEVSGTHTYNWVSNDEGYQYPIYTGDESRIKKLSNGTGNASQWWLRSPRLSSNQSFCIILTTGDDGYYYGVAANSQEGVCFGFCV